ncbi:hypothetical protein Q1695_003068 [Nippostrongylus brasiliensis]|nr:hypothetical protein Q1695_003068 [Nippostrongylus brasiliensis]
MFFFNGNQTTLPLRAGGRLPNAVLIKGLSGGYGIASRRTMIDERPCRITTPVRHDTVATAYATGYGGHAGIRSAGGAMMDESRVVDDVGRSPHRTITLIII